MKAKNDAKAIISDQLEEMFDNGDDILSYVDLGNPVVERHPPPDKRFMLTMPAWMVSERRGSRRAQSAATPSSIHGVADRLRTMRRRENAT